MFVEEWGWFDVVVVRDDTSIGKGVATATATAVAVAFIHDLI
jgi:peptidyl-tRNA hydrolase